MFRMKICFLVILCLFLLARGLLAQTTVAPPSQDLAQHLPTRGTVTEGLVYFPVANCAVANTPATAEGKILDGQTRELLIRGETTQEFEHELKQIKWLLGLD